MSLAQLLVKHRSLAVWPVVLTAGMALGTAATGCIIVRDDSDLGYEDTLPVVDDTIVVVGIDADRPLSAVPGDGVGLFVEYATGGLWRVWTTCDSHTPEASGASCGFDACVSVVDGSTRISGVEGEGLETNDSISTYGDGVTCLSASTDYDTDGMTFLSDPGAIVRLEMALDGYAEPRFIFWSGDGVLHLGAPSDPVDFYPTTP